MRAQMTIGNHLKIASTKIEFVNSYTDTYTYTEEANRHDESCKYIHTSMFENDFICFLKHLFIHLIIYKITTCILVTCVCVYWKQLQIYVHANNELKCLFFITNG